MLLLRTVFKFAASSKFQVVKNKYLIPVKPARIVSAYSLFLKEFKPKGTERPSQTWEKLSKDQIKAYEDKYAQQVKNYQRDRENYEKQYVEPFKKLSIINLVTTRIFQQHKDLQIRDAVRKSVALLENMSEGDKKQIVEKALQIKQQRQKMITEYEIPCPKTYLQFLKEFKKSPNSLVNINQKDSDGNPKSKTRITKEKADFFQKEYEKYLAQSREQVEKFAAKHGLTSKELEELMNKANPIKRAKSLVQEADRKLQKVERLVKSQNKQPKVKKAKSVKKDA